MTLHEKLIAVGLPVNGTATEGVTVLFTRPLTNEETNVYESIVAPNGYRQKRARNNAQQVGAFWSMTQEQAESYIDAQVVDLASAKKILRIYARLLTAVRDELW